MPTTLFFFNDTATTEIYTLSLHDALPICLMANADSRAHRYSAKAPLHRPKTASPGLNWVTFLPTASTRSEEHTSELQSHLNLVCRLLLEKKKKYTDL